MVQGVWDFIVGVIRFYKTLYEFYIRRLYERFSSTVEVSLRRYSMSFQGFEFRRRVGRWFYVASDLCLGGPGNKNVHF